jgi:hypothetical protein
MSGEKDLHKLLAGMSPELAPGEFVFCCFEKARYGAYSELQPIAAITESEGLTLVITKAKADEHSIDYEMVFSCITLKIHSSLDAVGLTAAFSGKLGDHGISANVIAGYHHDHIFVPQDQAQKAMTALTELSS